MQDESYYTNTRKEIFPFIPPDIKHTLDVGCAEGVFSGILKEERTVEAWGIEIVPHAANVAKKRLDKVLEGAFDDVYKNLPKKYFDCVFFNDVLEHMPCPEGCLEKIRSNIVPGGYVIASIPNMRFIQVLRDLVLKKDWKYADSGIMDRTHLRFFTQKSIMRMFNECGYKIERMKGIKPVSPYSLTSIINALTFNCIKDTKYYQFVVVARAKS